MRYVLLPSLLLALAALPGCGRPARPLPRPGAPGAGPVVPVWCVNINEGVNPGEDPKAGADPARWGQDLQSARQLGFRMVRIDFPWDAFAGTGGQAWDFNVIADFHQILEEARAEGLQVQGVIAHPPDPELRLYRSGDKARFFADYREFTRMLATEFGDDIHYYQYGNETNYGSPLSHEDAWRMMLAGDQGVRLAAPAGPHEGVINFIANILTEGSWLADASDDMANLNAADPDNTITTIGVDEYPDTWSLGRPRDFQAVDAVMKALDDPRSPLFGMRASVSETGFSSFVAKQPWVDRVYVAINQQYGFGSGLRNDGGSTADEEQGEADWYREALPALTGRLAEFNAAHPGGGFQFINLYTLHDDYLLKDPVFAPEANFGLLRHDLTPKPAAGVVSDFLAGSGGGG